jgi:glutaredoxin
VKEFLHQHDVAFEGIDVGEQPDALERIRAHTGGSVGTPTVVIDGEARIGFHPDWMAERLDFADAAS